MIRTILHISDTHGLHRQLTNLPEADVIIHSGDFTFGGTVEEAMDFCDWFENLPYRYKIYIAGNHDVCMHGLLPESDSGWYYLSNSGVELEGVKFYGLPKFMEDDIAGDYPQLISSIPTDTDVLVTHDAPHGILDHSGGISWGSVDLLHKVNEVKPRLHLFGHIHTAYGLQHSDGTLFSNAALVDDIYSRLVRQPVLHSID